MPRFRLVVQLRSRLGTQETFKIATRTFQEDPQGLDFPRAHDIMQKGAFSEGIEMEIARGIDIEMGIGPQKRPQNSSNVWLIVLRDQANGVYDFLFSSSRKSVRKYFFGKSDQKPTVNLRE